MSILGNDGLLNTLLYKLHISGGYTQFLYNKGAVILVSVYMYLPYAILPVFTAIDRFDFSLLEAARDLGATKPQSMLKVLIPNVKSGIVTAFIFTFIPIFGAYTVPLLVFKGIKLFLRIEINTVFFIHFASREIGRASCRERV